MFDYELKSLSHWTDRSSVYLAENWKIFSEFKLSMVKGTVHVISNDPSYKEWQVWVKKEPFLWWIWNAISIFLALSICFFCFSVKIISRFMQLKLRRKLTEFNTLKDRKTTISFTQNFNIINEIVVQFRIVNRGA